MNISELRQQLSDMEEAGLGEMEVMFSYNYGDHWHTQVAATIDYVAQENVKYSDYHRMHQVVEYDAELAAEGIEDEDTKKVLIIS